MSIKKIIDVCKPVMTRVGHPYQEPKTTPNGRFMLASGDSKRADQIDKDDEMVMEDVPLGRLLNMALDQHDDKLSGDERRKRFSLSVRIEACMSSGTLFEMDPEDRKRIEAAADLITNNHLFLYRIHEALETAEPVTKKANGVAEAAAQVN